MLGRIVGPARACAFRTKHRDSLCKLEPSQGRVERMNRTVQDRLIKDLRWRARRFGVKIRAVQNPARRLSTKDSDSRFDGDAAIWASAHLASGGETEDLHQLQGRRHTRPNGLYDLATTAGLANSLTINDTLGPAKAHLVEIEIGVLRTDMMKHAGDGAADPGLETFPRIDVNRIPPALRSSG